MNAHRAIIVAVVLMPMAGRVACAQSPAPSTTAPPNSPSTTVTVYPLLARVPIFGASIDLPSIPGGGGGEAGEQSGATDLSINAAYMAGFAIDAPRWFGEITGLWAALSASHSEPQVRVDSNTYFFTARGGVKVVDGVSATVGLRRVTTGLHAVLTPKVTPVEFAGDLHGSVKPGFWDPLLGIDWRGSLARGWSFDTDFQGGGFGVGTDVDLSGDFYADWHVARHVDLRFGYTLVYYKFTVDNVTIGSFERTLVSKQTLHGPAFGVGIVF